MLAACKELAKVCCLYQAPRSESEALRAKDEDPEPEPVVRNMTEAIYERLFPSTDACDQA